MLGAGGLGSYFAGRWAQAGLDVSLIARGAKLEALRDRGLTILSPLGDAEVAIRAVPGPAEAGAMDLVVVATKTWQLPAAAASLAPMLGPQTAVLGVQNGVEAADVLAAAVGTERVLAGTCRIISFVTEPGVVRHVGVQPTLTFGEPGGGGSERGDRIRDHLARGAGMTVAHSTSIEVDLWKKFLFFAPVSAIGAVTQVPVGAWRRIPAVRDLFARAMGEVLELARSRGVRLPDDSIELALRFLDGLPADGTSSLQRDVRDGVRTELDALCGAVVRLGAAAGFDTPVHAALHAALLPRELGARGELEVP